MVGFLGQLHKVSLDASMEKLMSSALQTSSLFHHSSVLVSLNLMARHMSHWMLSKLVREQSSAFLVQQKQLHMQKKRKNYSRFLALVRLESQFNTSVLELYSVFQVSPKQLHSTQLILPLILRSLVHLEIQLSYMLILRLELYSTSLVLLRKQYMIMLVMEKLIWLLENQRFTNSQNLLTSLLINIKLLLIILILEIQVSTQVIHNLVLLNLSGLKQKKLTKNTLKFMI